MAQNPYDAPKHMEKGDARSPQAVRSWWGRICLGGIAVTAVALAITFAIAIVKPEDPYNAETVIFSNSIFDIAFLAAFFVSLCSSFIALLGALGGRLTTTESGAA